ncbi:Protein disulfide-isomerase [Hondaea fermentalgiana]|uniref:Protein disulfide-isomerase n=1 Tax=Hondaea fermentalgiana TaxID=2315210 RepID=A0A2R5GL95_9STRA|nr:Protein disulfide-isomerase [Hondaea fermentalgiana]|eukprot:GBG31676.1 Protein disulfide-isomerase [Hondaea fermentalgiana]
MQLSYVALVVASLASMVMGEAVVHLTDDDFDAHVASNKYVLAEFYAPWCGHCKSLKPEYEKAAEHFKSVEVEGGLSIVAIDATENKNLASKYGIQGFPTLKWLVNGEDSEYTGGRTKDDIVAWVSKKTGPPAETIADEAALTAFKEKAEVVVLGAFGAEDSDAAKAFLAAAETDEDALYGITTEDAVKTAAGLSGDKVVVFRSFGNDKEPAAVECEGEITKDSVKKCVSGNLLPLVVPFSQKNAQKIFGGSIKQHCLIFIESEEANAAEIDTARTVAAKHKGDYLFVTVSKEDDRIMEFFGVQSGDIPTARIVVMGESMKKYKLEGDFSESALESFVDEHVAGKLSPDLKSEDPADEDRSNPVWILKGKTHDEVAFDSDKNVFIKYYAPWCGHCKKMAPDFDKLGEHYKDDEDVVIAKFDATANEVESVSVQGFPTIKFIPKGGSDESAIVDFDGSRDLEGMKSFVEANRK